MAMPNGGFFWGKGGSNLTTFVQNGSLPEARVNDSMYKSFFIASTLELTIWLSGNTNCCRMVSDGSRRKFDTRVAILSSTTN